MTKNYFCFITRLGLNIFCDCSEFIHLQFCFLT